jgi:hypothetical protein
MTIKIANIKYATIGWFLPTHLLPTHKKPDNCAYFFSLCRIDTKWIAWKWANNSDNRIINFENSVIVSACAVCVIKLNEIYFQTFSEIIST